MAGQPVLTQIALSGQAAPGTEAQTVFEAFHAPRIDDLGHVFFQADLSGPEVGSSNTQGIWSNATGTLTPVLRLGDTAPGIGEQYEIIGDPIAAGDGMYALTATLTGDVDHDNVIIAGSAGGTQSIVVREGEIAPGVGQVYRIPTDPLLNAEGHVGYTVTLGAFNEVPTGSGWIDQTLLDRELDSVGGLVPLNSVYTGGGAIQFLNDAGAGAFINTASPEQFTFFSGVWSGTPGSLTLGPVIASQTSPFSPPLSPPVPPLTPAPDVANGVFQQNGFVLQTINGNGDIAVTDQVRIDVSETQTLLREGLFAGAPTALSKVALQGEPAGPAGATFNDPTDPMFGQFLGFQGVRMNNAGQIAFRSEMNGPGITTANADAIWFGTAGDVKIIARKGDPAPNVPGSPGSTFQSVGNPIAIDNNGQLVFDASITLDGQSTQNSLWMYDAQTGEMTLLLRRLDTLDVNGTPRAVDSWLVASGNGEDGRATSLSNDGTLALTIDFLGADDPFGVYTIKVAPEAPESNIYIWDGLLDNQWWRDDGDVTNWVDENGTRHRDPPNSDQHVVIINSGNITLSRDGGGDTRAESITAAGLLTVATPLSFLNDSTFDVLTVRADTTALFGDVTINSLLSIEQGTFDAGPVTFADTSFAFVAGGVWKINGPVDIVGSGSPQNHISVESGTVEKIGAGEARIHIPFNTVKPSDSDETQSGTDVRLKVTEGDLTLAAGGSHEVSHPLDVPMIEITPISSVLTLGGSVSCTGDLQFRGAGTLRTDATTHWTIAQDAGIAIGAIAQSVDPLQFHIDGGEIQCDGVLVIHRPTRWSAGTLRGGAAVPAVDNPEVLIPLSGFSLGAATMEVIGPEPKILAGVFTIRPSDGLGTLRVFDDIQFDGGQLINRSKVSLSAHLKMGTGGAFVNEDEGVLTGVGGNSDETKAVVEVPYQSRGTHIGPEGPRVEVMSGTLRLEHADFRGGQMTIAQDTTLELPDDALLRIDVIATVGGTLMLGDGAGGGSVDIDGSFHLLPLSADVIGLTRFGGERLTIGGTLENQAELTLATGVVDLPRSRRLKNLAGGTLNINGSQLDAAGILSNEGTLRLIDSPNVRISSGGALANREGGVALQESAVNLMLEGDRASWLNEGSYTLHGSILVEGDAPLDITNYGTLTLDRAGGTVLIGGDMDNRGTITAEPNTNVIIDRVVDQFDHLNGGKWIVRDGAFVQLTRAPGEAAPALSVIEAGTTVELHGSGMLNNLPQDQGGSVPLLTISGALELHDDANWLGGRITLSGPPAPSALPARLLIGKTSRVSYDYPDDGTNAGFVTNGFAQLHVDGQLLVNRASLDTSEPTIRIGVQTRVTGSGLLSKSVESDGQIAPGLQIGPPPPDPFTFSRLRLRPNGFLDLPSFGAAGGNAHGLTVTGDLEIGGSLRLYMLNSLEPLTGQQFDFIDVGGDVTGNFDSIRVIGLDTGFQFDAGFDENGTFKLTALSDGVSIPGDVRGIVFDDLNGNGVLDANEPARVGVGVTIAPVSEDGTTGNVTNTTTDAAGAYLFPELPFGLYRVCIEPTDDVTATTPTEVDVLVLNGVSLVASEGQAMLPVNDPRLESVDPRLSFGFIGLDFGDAPLPYPSSMSLDGARHLASQDFHLGPTIDAEENAKEDDQATGDLSDDGVTIDTLLIGETTNVTVNVVLPDASDLAFVDAWIDLNADGDWDDAGEHVVESKLVFAGDNTVPIAVPDGAMEGETFARFRLSDIGTSSPRGEIFGGEVEDYRITLMTAPRTEVARFGKAFNSVTKQVIADGLGNSFEVSISGDGTVVVLQEASGRLSFSIEDSSAKSTLTIKPKSGDATIDSLDSTGDIKSVSAKGVNFVGGINIAGSITSFAGGNVADQHVVSFGGAATDKPIKVTLDSLTNVTMTSGAPLALTVLSWTDTDHATNPDSLTAPYATALTVKGDKKTNTPAVWQADVTLTGQGATTETLKSFKADILAAAAFDITGDVGSIAIKESVSDWALALASTFKSITMGDAANVSLTVPGDGGAVKATRWLDGAYVGGSIKNLTTTGDRKANISGDLDIDVTLTGHSDPRKSTLGNTKLAGDLLGGAWKIAGNADSISAMNVAPQWTASFTGDVKSLSANLTLSGAVTANSVKSASAKADIANFALTLMQPVLNDNGKTQALGKLSAKNVLDHLTIDSAGHIGSIAAAALIDSDIRAGVLDNVVGLVDSADQFTAQAIIKSVSIKGRKNEPFSVIASNLAASTIEKLTLTSIDGDNAGVPFGAAAAAYKTVTIKQADGTIKLSKPADFDEPTVIGDAVIRGV